MKSGFSSISAGAGNLPPPASTRTWARRPSSVSPESAHSPSTHSRKARRGQYTHSLTIRTGTSGVSAVAGGAGRSSVSWVEGESVSWDWSASSTSEATSDADATSDTGEDIRNKPRWQPH